MRPRVLLADDDVLLTRELAQLLERSDFLVAIAHDGEEVLKLVETLRPDIIVLDIIMPRLNGREVCRRLRARGDLTPLIMLTKVGTSFERVMSLEEGADDYLNKPFDPFELVARIKAVLRRVAGGGEALGSARRLKAGPLLLDRVARRVYLDGKELPLTTKAFVLLEYLMLHHGEVIRRERLLEEIWGWNYPGATRAVDVRVAELRKALGEHPDARRFIETTVGEGYCFTAPVSRG
jgi:DNA-binding response OmpR family regulator